MIVSIRGAMRHIQFLLVLLVSMACSLALSACAGAGALTGLGQPAKVNVEDPLCKSFAVDYSLMEQTSFVALIAGKVSADYLAGVAQSNSKYDFASLQKLILDRLKLESKDRLWVPASLEQAVGDEFHAQLVAQDQSAVDSGQSKLVYSSEELSPRKRKEFDKAQAALNELKAMYPAGTVDNVKLFYFDDPAVQATAAPGGYVYVYSGLLKSGDPEQLRLILGHELAHVYKRHYAKQTQSKFMQLVAEGTQFKSAVEQIVANPKQMNTLTQAMAAFGTVSLTKEQLRGLMEGVSQGQESEADGCGAAVVALIEKAKGCETVLRFSVAEDAAAGPFKSTKQEKLEEQRDDLIFERDALAASQSNSREQRQKLNSLNLEIHKVDSEISKEQKQLDGLKKKREQLVAQRKQIEAMNASPSTTKKLVQIDKQIADVDRLMSAMRLAARPSAAYTWQIADHPPLTDRRTLMVNAFNAHKPSDVPACVAPSTPA